VYELNFLINNLFAVSQIEWTKCIYVISGWGSSQANSAPTDP